MTELELVTIEGRVFGRIEDLMAQQIGFKKIN